MIKPSTAPDYIYDMLPWFEIVCGGWRSFFFISTQLPFSFGQKHIFSSVIASTPLRIVMTLHGAKEGHGEESVHDVLVIFCEHMELDV